MGKNRKLPFGYKMDRGSVVVDPDEALWVRYIYQQYTSGVSFCGIADKLSLESISYESGKKWNKNMVSRILADSRYIGEKSYPAMIDTDLYKKASVIRNMKKTTSPKSEAQKILRKKLGYPVTAYLEKEVLFLLNSLAGNPERIVMPGDVKTESDALWALKSELDGLLRQLPVDEKKAREKLMQIAVAMYETIDSREYETYRLREVFRKECPRSELDAKLIALNVSAVYIDQDGKVRVTLKNGQILERGE